MADQLLTIKDIAAREGTSDLVGLIEDVVNVAPEIDHVQGRVIPGVYYTARIRTALMASRAFRRANQGVALGASSYDRKRFDCYFFDAQMRLDEAVAQAAEFEGDSAGKLMAEEASGAMRAKALYLGRQFYDGTLYDAEGCPGLVDFIVDQQAAIDSRTGSAIDQVVDAGGSTATNNQTMWFVHIGPQGVHFLFGGGRGLTMRPWREQQVVDSNSNKFWAFVSNVSGYIGTSCANRHAIGAIKNIDTTTTTYTLAGHSVTDGMVASLWAKFPIGLKPTHCFASQKVIALLQQSRTATLFANLNVDARGYSGGVGPVAPWPTNLPTAGNIPIIPTDSIVNYTAAVAY